MATFPLATLGVTIDSAGITAPSYDDLLASLKASMQTIYGSDIYLEADSQDGQWMATLAKSIKDCNDGAIAAYNSFRPSAAQGEGLSSIVKFNHIRRLIATASQVSVDIIGQSGTNIINGFVGDAGGNRWALPASVTIPPLGSITVTATAEDLGALTAPSGTVTRILTPTPGWQEVNNPAAATPGAAVETDAELRARQEDAPSLTALTVLAATVAAITSIDGVLEVKAYENDTNSTDADGLPPHSISLVIRGGDDTEIATAIMKKKTPGAYTHGSTSIFITDSAGVTHQIRFYRPTDVPLSAEIVINDLAGWSTATEDLIKQAVADYINELPIGQDVLIARLYIPAQLGGTGAFDQFELQSVEIGPDTGPTAAADIVIAFNERAVIDVADITVTV